MAEPLAHAPAASMRLLRIAQTVARLATLRREVPVPTEPITSSRRATRHIVRIPCEAVRERDFSLVGSVILDLSVHGAMIRTKRKVLTGEPVILSFFDPYASRYFDVEASVARVIHGRRRIDRERAVALEFHSLGPLDRVDLWQLLKRRPFATATQS